jgi:hypothetical protein
MQEPRVASRNALFVVPVTPAPLGRRTMVVRKTLVGSRRATSFLPSVVGDAIGGGGTEDGGVTGSRQGPHRQHRPSPRLLLKLSLGMVSCPARRALSSLTR